MSWEIVVGIETHAQLLTKSKIFSGASTDFGAPPNTQASAVDIALPGTLPVLNRAAVEHAIRFGLAVKATINRRSIFARKKRRSDAEAGSNDDGLFHVGAIRPAWHAPPDDARL
jgi:Asp-tRNA(Asn)/Glu-tRNA(Gln) amidotransferase B subunit